MGVLSYKQLLSLFMLRSAWWWWWRLAWHLKTINRKAEFCQCCREIERNRHAQSDCVRSKIGEEPASVFSGYLQTPERRIGSGKLPQNTTVLYPSLLCRRWLHVSTALLGHHQVTGSTSEETTQCTNISYGTYFYKIFQRDLVVTLYITNNVTTTRSRRYVMHHK